MKKYFVPLLLLVVINIYSQKGKEDYHFGILNSGELKMATYEKDTTANAVVLFEEGKIIFFDKNYRPYTRNTIYKKIKILKKEGAKHVNIRIYIYNSTDTSSKEKILKIKAITHNMGSQTSLQKAAIYTTRINEHWKEVTFAMPNVKEGSVVEYSYEIESPYLYHFTGWDFQSSIPKIESVFKAEIPGNYVYNRKLVGLLRLTTNNASLKKKCFNIEGVSGYSDCEVLTYAMKDIPAFIEEDYMTSKKNFLSRIDFEFSEHKRFDGVNTKYTTTWDAVDYDYRKDKNIGGQLKRKSFFEGVLPPEIIATTDELEKAKKVFYFMQNHYSWNEEYKLFNGSNVKKAYKEGVGTVGEINISLINALDASGIDAELAVMSTRKNGYPTKLYPVITEFNYLIAKVLIDGKSYFLDATVKNLPFGMLPYRCLNKEVRVMDFKNGSYWEDIVPVKKNGTKIQMLLEYTEDGTYEGSMRIVRNGYNALNKRENIKGTTEEKYVIAIEDKSESLEIISYSNYNLEAIEKTLTEEFEIILETDNSIADYIYLNPFFVGQIEENPFKLKERLYPVDFGYARKFDFILSMEIPEGYKIETLPKSKAISLPDNGGKFVYQINHDEYKIRINFKYILNKPYFYSNEYHALKEIFNQMILSQNEPVVLKKDSTLD